MNWLKVFNPETRLVWEYWEARISSLMQIGWDFKVEELSYYRGVRLLGQKQQQRLVSETIPISLMHDQHLRGIRDLRVNVSIAERIEFIGSELPVVANMESVVIGISMNPYDSVRTFDDFEIFTKDKVPEEFVVNPSKIGELLAKIREAQEPRAKEILKKQRRRDEVGETLKVDAKILTLVS